MSHVPRPLLVSTWRRQRQAFVLHGEFDVQVDFSVDPAFHQHGLGAANAKLFLLDEEGNALEASIRSGFYASIELPSGGQPTFQHLTPTDDQAGRLRIVRTLLPTDATPPVITVPAGITVNATSPAGAHVTLRRHGDGRESHEPDRDLHARLRAARSRSAPRTVACTATRRRRQHGDGELHGAP